MINGLEEISYTMNPCDKRILYRKLSILFMALSKNCDRVVNNDLKYMTKREEEREHLFLYNADLVLSNPHADIDEILEYADTFIKYK